jgi:CheY-like chemotaxis protein
MSLVGNLEDLGLGEILQIVSLSRKSGILVLHSRGRQGEIVFRQGQVIRASSSTYRQTLGEVLLQKNIISLQTLQDALATQERDGFRQRLGAILTRDFNVSAGAIEEVVREQIENIAYSLFAWSEGTFDFELQDNLEASDDIRMDPMQFMLEQGLNPQFLAMEGSRMIDERRHRGESLDDDVPLPETTAMQPEESVDLAFDLLQEPSSSVAAPSTEPLQVEPSWGGIETDTGFKAEPACIPDVWGGVAGVGEQERLVILVDDDTGTREVMTDALQGAGYTVVASEKSEDALIQIDTRYRAGHRPGILVDLIMPRMDGSGILGGLELLEMLKNNFADLPVLVLADYHNNDAERRVRELGYSFSMKPRKSELGDDEVVSVFGRLLLESLRRVEAGEAGGEWSDKINLGDEIRLEMGEVEGGDSRPAVQPSTGLSLLRGMLEELNDPALGGGIILLVLRFASEFMNRAVIFLVKRDEICGLGQFGIVNESGSPADARVRSMCIPRDVPSLFTRVIEDQLPGRVALADTEWNRYIAEHLGGGCPSEVFLGPIVSEGKVVAILYGDNLPDSAAIGDTDSLEIFLSQAGIAMEKALLQRRLKEKSQEEL